MTDTETTMTPTTRISIDDATHTMTIEHDGLTLKLSPQLDRRVVGFRGWSVVVCRSAKAARELDRELRNWGVTSVFCC